MNKFIELEYTRPNFSEIKRELKEQTKALDNSGNYNSAKSAILAVEKIQSSLATQYSIAYIRNTCDTSDQFYEEEIAFFDKNLPTLIGYEKKYTEVLLGSMYRPDLENEYGTQMFDTAEADEILQSKKIMFDLIAENNLKTKYNKVAASCKTEFNGEECNFYGLLRYMENPDRSVRKKAYEAWSALYENVSAELDKIFDQLVALRIKITKKLGLKSYTEYSYLSMHRLDYTPDDVASFREQVVNVIVPVCKKLRDNQKKRLGVDKLRYYDEALTFKEGNPTPNASTAYMLGYAKDMYHNLSPETGEFFDYMLEHQLFDLETRPSKHLGGYCTMLPDYKAPFVFSNFNGTSADVDVLTHECGHAFQYYLAARCQPFEALCNSTSEINEIHSMSMEFFTYPWMNRFFGAESAKYRYSHMCDALMVIPYLTCVDEFQHIIYERPVLNAAERRSLWHELEQKYMPWRDYDGNEFLEGGGFWMQKQHIFLYPFYYIDYALAQICTFELCGKMKTDFKSAWADYLTLCKAGGSLGYRQLLTLANLTCPFDNGAVLKAITPIVKEIAAYNG
ncbi:MAG: M3 family oligoendopeptidase [Oscillospiraceae bacterium]